MRKLQEDPVFNRAKATVDRTAHRAVPVSNGGVDMTNRPSGLEPGWVRMCAGIVSIIDGLCRWSGYLVAWAALATVLLCFATVYLRYAMGIGLIWLQESYIWTHVAVIVLGAGYTMMSGGFVRVDVFYAKWSPQRRALSDMVMTVVLLGPFLWIFGNAVWTFWGTSWASDEGSLNPGGLPNFWILKATLLGFVGLVSLQGVAIVLRGAMVLAGHEQHALNHGGHDASQLT